MSSFAVSLYQSTASIISQLAALLQLKHQPQTPFDIHPTTMLVAVSSIIFGYLLHVGLLRSPRSPFAAVAELLYVWSTYAVVSALAAPLFPGPDTPFIVGIFGILSAGEVWHLFRENPIVEEEEEDEDEEADEEGELPV